MGEAGRREEMAVTPRYILQGSVYALQQCGLLLRGASILYRNGAHANAVVLTLFAQEELGQSRLLDDLWRKASAGDTLTMEQIRDACKDHVAKQQAGMVSLTMRADNDSGLGKILLVAEEDLGLVCVAYHTLCMPIPGECA
jgi:AbiV family abortive infection protein